MRNTPLGNYPTEQPSYLGAGLSAILGIICIAAGVYFLWIEPSNSESSIVSIHKLTLGQTLAISGAIFLSAGITASSRK